MNSLIRVELVRVGFALSLMAGNGSMCSLMRIETHSGLLGLREALYALAPTLIHCLYELLCLI